MFHEYPKWLYHKTLPPVIVNTPEEEAALGPGWFNSPDQAAVQPEQAPTSQPTETPKPNRPEPQRPRSRK